jgi:hypothetical protein
MRVQVRVKGKKLFNRTEGGKVVSYTEGKTLEVSQHVYETFRHQLEAIGDAPKPALQVRSNTPDTDDDDAALQEVRRAMAADVVAQLAEVGLNVDPSKVLTWTDKDLERLPKLIERGGKQPPKFVTDALVAAS